MRKQKYIYNPEKLSYEKHNSILGVLFVASLILIAIFSYLRINHNINRESQYEKEVDVIVENILHVDSVDFSFPEFKQYVLDLNLKFPDIVIAQALIESGNFSSPIWEENNNPFGMKVAKSRNTTSTGVNRGHATYKDWKMAVVDYSYLQAVFARKIKTREGYYEFLNSYAEDKNYRSKIIKKIREYKGFGISNDYLNDL